MESHKRKLITDIELSEIIGLSCQTIRKHRWLKSGLPYIRIRRTVRYDIDQVEAYLKKCRVIPKNTPCV